MDNCWRLIGKIVKKYNKDKFTQATTLYKTPCIIYDKDFIIYNIKQILFDATGINEFKIYFAEKANRNVEVLTFLREIGIGIDIASVEELDVALKCGFKDISATSPSLKKDDIKLLYENNIVPDFDSLSQLRNYCMETELCKREIGVRIKLMHQVEDDTTYMNSSRFGINISSNEFRELVKKYDLKVQRIHIHVGEYKKAEVLKIAINQIKKEIINFPELKSINFGGGITYLYTDAAEVKAFWKQLHKFDEYLFNNYGRNIKMIIEPGMFLLLNAGYLMTKVLYINERSDGNREVIVDASAWCLYSWQPIKVIAKFPTHGQEKYKYRIVGSSCYEEDIFIPEIFMSELREGDYLIWGYSGAYMSSMMRNMHGFNIDEYLL